jgi:hypothetical protein
MSASNDYPAYADCFEFFDRALASARGVRVLFSTHTQAVAFRFRMNRARALDRIRNQRIYASEPDHPNYGHSVYASILIVINYDDERDVYLMELRKVEAAIADLIVEDIPGPEEASEGED